MAMDKDLNPMLTSADARGMGMKGILGWGCNCAGPRWWWLGWLPA